MSSNALSFSAARRRLLRLVGLGAAGTVVGVVAASERIFAKQFIEEGPVAKLPKMVYDPQLQMMVDPDTRQPIFDDASKIDVASGLPTVTSGCGDCPKKDDTGS
jgi:hypothetical protein